MGDVERLILGKKNNGMGAWSSFANGRRLGMGCGDTDHMQQDNDLTRLN